NFGWISLKEFLRETLDLGRDDLFKGQVNEGFSLVNTDASHSERIIEPSNTTHHEGRQVNVDISTSGGGAGRRDHNGRGGRSSGGFRGERSSSDRRPAGGDRFSNDRKTESRFGRSREDDRPARSERRAVRGDRPRRSN